jgi:hypothetical protein
VSVLQEGKKHVGRNETRDGLEYIKAFVKKNNIQFRYKLMCNKRVESAP